MKAKAKLANYTLVLNPTGAFDHVSVVDLFEALGPLPQWLDEGLGAGEPAQEALISRYVYYTGEFNLPDEATFDQDGTFHYPEDDAQAPLATAQLTEETVHFYQHAFVAIIQKDGATFMTRMD